MEVIPSTLDRSKPIVLAAIVIAIIASAGCSTSKPVVTNSIQNAPTTADLKEYTIGVGDQLAISVWRNPDLSVTVPVRPDGKISVPLAGDLTAAGVTPQELSDSISDKLTEFLKGPQVTVIVTNPASADFQRRVRITGAVGSPLSLPYREGMTVLDIVLLAGGTNDFASAGNTKLFRKTDKGVETYKIDLDDLLNRGDLSQNYPLQPSDVITVPERLF